MRGGPAGTQQGCSLAWWESQVVRPLAQLGLHTKRHARRLVSNSYFSHFWWPKSDELTAWREGPCSGCRLVTVSPLTWQRGEAALWGPFRKGTDPSHTAPSSRPNQSAPEAPPPNAITLGVRLQHMDLRDTHAQTTAALLENGGQFLTNLNYTLCDPQLWSLEKLKSVP